MYKQHFRKLHSLREGTYIWKIKLHQAQHSNHRAGYPYATLIKAPLGLGDVCHLQSGNTLHSDILNRS
ncbi:hypothetical protein XENTR_v10007155 [Xenopus tropicalis]|nr:hypothetical protein XENTR_v10007155 [Xenopus tropicalis]